MIHEEKIQVVDEHTGEPTGEIVPRKEIFERNLWCRTTNIFILNKEGQVLCQKRSSNKERFPGVWITHFGGHVTEGESFRINAVKEVEEELGLLIPMFQMIPWRTSCKIESRIWTRDFVTVYNGPLEKLIIQKSEVDHIEWYSPAEILNHIENKLLPEWITELSGFHEFREDYQCLRAVLTACLDIGIFGGPFIQLKNWHPEDIQAL